jgi:hypothetical protein
VAKGSDLLVAALENEGVAYIFAIPGEENLDVLDSLRRSKIKLVLTRHEQAAGAHTYVAEIDVPSHVVRIVRAAASEGRHPPPDSADLRAREAATGWVAEGAELPRVVGDAHSAFNFMTDHKPHRPDRNVTNRKTDTSVTRAWKAEPRRF